MITLDAMMKFAKTPNTDATQSSGDQPSYSTGLSVGVAVSSGAGERVSQSSRQIKKEKHVLRMRNNARRLLMLKK